MTFREAKGAFTTIASNGGYEPIIKEQIKTYIKDTSIPDAIEHTIFIDVVCGEINVKITLCYNIREKKWKYNTSVNVNIEGYGSGEREEEEDYKKMIDYFDFLTKKVVGDIL